MQLLQELLMQGASVAAAGENGVTALHLASLRGSAEAVQMLLAAGAATETQDNRGFSALHYAASGCAGGRDSKCPGLPCSTKIQLLLDAGATPNAAHNGTDTPLGCAAYTGHSTGVKALCEHMAAAAAKQGVAVPQNAYSHAWRSATQQGHGDIIRVLIDAGADPLYTPPGRNNALISAVCFDSPAAVKSLIQHCSRERLTAAVLTSAAGIAARRAQPGDVSQNQRSKQQEITTALLQAAIERSDAGSVLAVLRGVPVGFHYSIYAGFMQAIVKMQKGLEDEAAGLQSVVQQLSIEVAQAVLPMGGGT